MKQPSAALSTPPPAPLDQEPIKPNVLSDPHVPVYNGCLCTILSEHGRGHQISQVPGNFQNLQ